MKCIESKSICFEMLFGVANATYDDFGWRNVPGVFISLFFLFSTHSNEIALVSDDRR